MDGDNVQQALDAVIPVVTHYGLQIIGAVLILIVGRIAASGVGSFVDRALVRAKVDDSLRKFLVSLVRIAVIAFAVIAALAKFGVQTTSFVAVLGAAGFAIGFALQGSLGNFASGVMLLIFRPIKVGDLIEAAGYLGVVEEVGLFVTTINTLDNQRVIIPNSTLTRGVINNVNGNGLRRVDMTAGISYADDMDKAKTLCMEVLRSHPKVLADPEPTVAVFEMADSSVNLVVRPWCNGDDYWTVWFECTQRVKEAFDANGITIPFPQRDVHLLQPRT